MLKAFKEQPNNPCLILSLSKDEASPRGSQFDKLTVRAHHEGTNTLQLERADHFLWPHGLVKFFAVQQIKLDRRLP